MNEYSVTLCSTGDIDVAVQVFRDGEDVSSMRTRPSMSAEKHARRRSCSAKQQNQLKEQPWETVEWW